jgi:hypothetical protein
MVEARESERRPIMNATQLKPVNRAALSRIETDAELKAKMIAAKKTFTLSDLVDKDMLAAWLGLDGNSPIVKSEDVGGWWRNYRESLSEDWSKTADYRKIYQTRGQWMDECLKATGIKAGGTRKDRLQRAIAKRPDLYINAATLKANVPA